MILYEEQQKFNQLWLWALLIAVTAIMLVDLYPALRDGGSMKAVMSVCVMAAVAIVFALLSLRTTISEDRLTVGFYPFGGKTIFKRDIQRAYVRTYSPLGEYGGWGYRIGKSGTAYNTMGSEGLQLVLRNGERVLIGTQSPEVLKRVIEAWLG